MTRPISLLAMTMAILVGFTAVDGSDEPQTCQCPCTPSPKITATSVVPTVVPSTEPSPTFLPAIPGRRRGPLLFPLIGAQFLGNEEPSAYDTISGLGMSMCRIRIIIRDSVPIAWIDREVDRCISAGMTPLIVFWDWSDGEAHGDCSTSQLKAYRLRVKEMAWRYRGLVSAWEIDNEPDACEASTTYAWRLATAYEAIKAADTGALVVVGGLRYEVFQNRWGEPSSPGGVDYWWLDRVLATLRYTRCFPCFDVLAIHSYSDFWSRWPGGLSGKIADVKSKAGGVGLQPRIWITEGGAPSNSDKWHQRDEASQAEAVVDYLQACREHDIEVCIVYRAQDEQSETQKFGIIDKFAAPAIAAFLEGAP